jgi:rhamnulokinase
LREAESSSGEKQLMADQIFLAVDLGASSGRVVAGAFDGRRIALEELHRFDNGPVSVGSRMYWDLLSLWSHVQQGMQAAAARYGKQVRSLGVDTWGVDFALLGRGDELLGNPRHYRDPHTDGILEQAFSVVPREEIFAETGLQFMQFNTLYQLWALRRADSALLDAAESLLLIPDLFHWLLTGSKGNETTNATTTQCLNPRTGRWSPELIERFDLPSEIFGPVLAPGTDLGPLQASVAAATGLTGTRVLLPGTHDTASAVMAVPARSGQGAPDWCYISSGTWSLMGVELEQPLINARCEALNFTNEGGVGETTRLLKNIAGLWLVQECRRIWKGEGRSYGWDELVRMADQAPPLAAFVDPDDRAFLAPADMPRAIREFCGKTGQTVPENDAAVIRCALESLALKYRRVLGWLEELVGSRLETIHIVGGGAQNSLLCQLTADACGRRVLAGPGEATATGNLMLQAVASGALESIAAARAVIRDSFPLVEFVPQPRGDWEAAYQRFVSFDESKRR